MQGANEVGVIWACADAINRWRNVHCNYVPQSYGDKKTEREREMIDICVTDMNRAMRYVVNVLNFYQSKIWS